MLKKLILLAMTISMPVSIFAADEIDLWTYYFPEQVWNTPLRSEQDLSTLLKLGPREALVTLKEYEDNNRTKYYRLRQTYQGVPVFGRQILLSLDSEGKMKRLTGKLIRDLHKDLPTINPTLHAKAAQERVQQQHDYKGYSEDEWIFTRENQELVIFLDKSEKAYLAYLVSYFADTRGGGNPTRPFYILDAHTGKQLREPWEGLNREVIHAYGPGGNLKTGKYIYSDNADLLFVTKNGNTCSMYLSFWDNQVRAVNLNHGDSENTTYAFECPWNNFKEINGAYSPINDAFYFGQSMAAIYGPDLPLEFVVKVHYGNHQAEAFWDGESVTFGDGNNHFFPLVSLDVVSHEMAHAYTEYYSNLLYENESGGINESFSDISGEYAEYYLNGVVTGQRIFLKRVAF